MPVTKTLFGSAAALVFAVLGVAGCHAADSAGEDVDESAEAISSIDVMSRARAWVGARMPYCNAIAGGRDLLCGGTCARTGAASTPEWNAYRSDAPGFVSWAWGLPAPGRTIGGFAPYSRAVSTIIPVDALRPGDALNSDRRHIVLFGGWSDKAARKALILEEAGCDEVAKETIKVLETTGQRTVKIDGVTFTAIRFYKKIRPTADGGTRADGGADSGADGGGPIPSKDGGTDGGTRPIPVGDEAEGEGENDDAMPAGRMTEETR